MGNTGFEFGYSEAAPNGYEWLKHPPFIDLAEQFK